MSDDVLDVIPFVGGAYLIHVKIDGHLVPRSISVLQTMKFAFKRGCMKLSDGNVVVSYEFAFLCCTTQFLTWYKFNKQMISICQIFINLAETSIK